MSTAGHLLLRPPRPAHGRILLFTTLSYIVIFPTLIKLRHHPKPAEAPAATGVAVA